MDDLIIRDATLVTMGEAGVVRGDIAVADGRIVDVGTVRGGAKVEIAADGEFVLPGFVQAHVHLCQTLFRGVRDDVDVVDWLHDYIWPLEQAHTPESMYASCRLGAAELLLGGTTTALSLETVNHTDQSFQAAEELGIRAFIGKALMDRREPGTEMWGESTEDASADLRRILERWDGAAGGRLRVALSPRCPRGVTPELWQEVVALAHSRGLVMHTHVAESRFLTEMAETTPEGRDVTMLEHLGALGDQMVMAHTVWLSSEELDLVARRGAHVCHCPSANLKLASGIAPIPTYLERGINVALGADGAACNNNLDAFQEMRMAALIHKVRFGPKAMPAQSVLEMATLGGARALGMEAEIGSLEVGKQADITMLWPIRPRSAPRTGGDPLSEIVYSRSAHDVRTVIVGGQIIVRDGVLQTADEQAILAEAEAERARILDRTGLRLTGPAH